MKQQIIQVYNKHYKKLLIIPALLLILSLLVITNTYIKTGDYIYRDVSLTGGTTITFSSNISVSEMENLILGTVPDTSVMSLSDNTGKQTRLIITTKSSPEIIKPELEKILGYELTDENSSMEFSGSSLSNDFYNQLVRALIFAFILMAFVVFFVFGESMKIKVYCAILTLICARLTFPSSRFLNAIIIILGILFFVYGLYLSKQKKDYYYLLASFLAFIIFLIFPVYFVILPIGILLILIYTFVSVPSIAVIFAAFADILFALALVNLLGIKISSAGIVAFLMLIGYSVDTDILLTTRVLRRKNESVNSSMFSAFKTGITMTLTAIAAVGIALIVVYKYETVLNQIFSIMIIGLSFDILNTWLTNAVMIKWFVEKKHG